MRLARRTESADCTAACEKNRLPNGCSIMKKTPRLYAKVSIRDLGSGITKKNNNSQTHDTRDTLDPSWKLEWNTFGARQYEE
eukprot:379437-Pyramimonas_sp.AAC.1